MMAVCGNLLHKHIKTFSALMFIAAFCLLFPQILKADALSSPRVFTRGNFVYVVEPRRIAFLSMDTRGSHTLYVAADSQFTIVSATRVDDMIWASNNMGAVMAVNMQTGNIEEFGRGQASVGGGQIDVDRRFVWLASGDTLYRMDLTSREWVSLPIPGKKHTARGLIGFNDKIHIITGDAVYILNTASEDWVVVPHRNFVLGDGDFHKIDELAIFTREKTVYKYDPSKKLWNKVSVGSRIRAIDYTSDRMTIGSSNRVYNITTRDFSLTPHPALPMLRDIRSITSHNGRTVCAVNRGLAIYNTPFDFNIVSYPDHINIGDDIFTFSYYNHIVFYTGDGFIIYNHEYRLWNYSRIVNRNEETVRKNQYTWDENGARINVADKYPSTVSGTLTLRQRPSMTYSETDGLLIDPALSLANATINVRAESMDGRTLDLTADNATSVIPPQKGFYYKGIDDDILNRASFGVQNFGLAASQVTPNALTEGASAFFSGKTKVENRDRNLVTAVAGSGFVLSNTEWEKFGYTTTGIYEIRTAGNREIVARSVKMYIDGIPLSETDFVYNPNNHTVRLLRRDKTDPTSIMQISFSVKAIPDDSVTFEPLPKNHFGQYNFVEGAISPRSWLSARAGFMTLDKEGTFSPIILAGVPIELRGRSANRSMLFHPEIAYDPQGGTQSTGVDFGVRENNAFGSYRGLLVGRDYDGVDKHAFDNRYVRGEHEINVGYDLRDNLRASWYQLHRRIDGSDLSHFELRTSYIGKDIMPDIEMSASSRIMDVEDDENHLSKETFMLRLSDPSSRILGEMNRICNVGYDLSWTEYQSSSNRRGRVIYGTADVSPINSLTFAGAMIYRLNPNDYRLRTEINPSLAVYMRDLPKGFDVSATYTVYVTDVSAGGTDVGIGRNLSGYFYPGEYTDALQKFILYFGYGNVMESHVSSIESPLKNTFVSDKNTSYQRTNGDLGLIYLPAENMLLSTVNSIYSEIDSTEKYNTNERMKLWLENGSSLETNIGAAANASNTYLNADVFYEHKWSNGFLTGVGVFGAHNLEESNTDVYCGPQFSLSYVKNLNGFIGNIENYHWLRVTVNAEEASNSDIEYTFYMRLRMPPNISLVAELSAAVKKLSNVNVWGGIYLHAGF